jgi:predicted RNA-binding protein YlxR (DUF448 family)
LRTCIVCRQTRGKRELVRIVRTTPKKTDGTPVATVQVDPTGKLAGRGAYLCRARACWDQVLTGHKLSAALKTTISPEDLAALKAFAVTLPEALISEE